MLMRSARVLRRTQRPASRLLSAAAASRRIGQPTAATHPHLLAPHEATPGVAAAEYAARRSRLAAALRAGRALVAFNSVRGITESAARAHRYSSSQVQDAC